MSTPAAQFPRLHDVLRSDVKTGNIQSWLNDCFDFSHSHGGGSSSIGFPSVALHSIVSDLVDHYTVVERVNPDGSVWEGVLLPQAVLDYTRNTGVDPLDRARGNLLDIACDFGASDDTLKILIASGFDPCKFSKHIKMTPVGQCAFDGNASALKLFAQAGFDLSLPMSSEHCRDPSLVGSNLLYRLLNKKGVDSDEGLAVVEVLLEAGVDPLNQNLEGTTALQISSGNVRVMLERWLASQQSRDMARDTLLAPDQPRTLPRL